MNALEEVFKGEIKGSGSSSPYVVDAAGREYVGFDINPEDIEALFFDGIGVPRWASIEAADVDEQNAIYMERYNEVMAKFPMLGRANDTYEATDYTTDDVTALLAECEAVKAVSTHEKAIRAVNKFTIVGTKAAEKQAGLTLSPSH